MHQLTSFVIVVNGNEKKIIENYSFQFIEVGMKNRLFENEIVHFIFTSLLLSKNDYKGWV